MTKQLRYDIGELAKPIRTPDGRLRASVNLTRTGVFRYRNADGSERLEWRPPEEVFKPESMRTAEMMVFTDDHPPIHLDSTTATKYARGSTGETITQNGKFLTGSVVVFDADTIQKMENGKREVSCGYYSDVELTPGITPDGERYDMIQRNIEYNHLALVDRGRAGSDVRVRMDAAMMINDSDETQKEPLPMKELLDAIAAKVAAENELAIANARADKAEAQLVSLQKDLEVANQSRKDAEDSFMSRVQARTSLELVASKHLDSADTSKMSDREIMVAVVKKIDGDDLGPDKSNDWVQAMFEGAVKRADRGSAALGAVRTTIEIARNDSPDTDPEAAARAKMDSERINAFLNVKGF